MNGLLATKVAIATGILIWAVFEDLRSRKFSNRSFLIACGVALATRLIVFASVGSASELVAMTLGFGAGIVFFLPLVLSGVVGAGDMKLMAAVGIIAGWEAVLWAGLYGLIWAGVFGVTQVFVRGQFRQLKDNITNLAITREKGNLQLHHIPFTAPLLLGWLSYLVLSGGFR